MTSAFLQLDEKELRVNQLIIDDSQIVGYFSRIPPDEVEDEFRRAVKIGVICLERASASQDLDFVRNEIGKLLNEVETKTNELPSRLETAVMGKIGTGKGQALSEIPGMVREMQAAVNGKIADVRTLLDTEIDPSKADSAVAKALGRIGKMLDPTDTGSIQYKLAEAIANTTSQEGAIATTVRGVVQNTVRELERKFIDLQTAVTGRKAEEGIVDQTTLKGTKFEEEVLREVEQWGAVTGCTVEHVGPENRPGDVLVISRQSGMMEEATRLIIEAKDDASAYGRKRVSDIILEAMKERNANAGILVKKTSQQFGKDTIDWAEGDNERGTWVSCSFDNLPTALRFVFVQRRIVAIRKATPEVDTISIGGQVQTIRTSLEKISNVRKSAGHIRNAVDAIDEEVLALRGDVNDALAKIETALQHPGSNQNPSVIETEKGDLPF